MDALMTRGDAPEPTPLHGLSTMQRRIVETVGHYESATGDPCPGRYLARRLNLHHSTVQTYLGRLHRQGWLRTPSAPVRLARRIE